MTVLMECGHASNAVAEDQPVCAICAPSYRAYVVADEPDLMGRTAKCGPDCQERPSSFALAFFEYLGPGCEKARIVCKHCRYFESAHDPAEMDKLVHNRDGSRRETVVESGKCPGFEAHGPFDHDRYYCGCRGWD